MTTQTQAALRRFGKVVAAAIVAQLFILAGTGVQINGLDDLKRLGYALISAVITGALLGIHKFINWNETPPAPAFPEDPQGS
jgi:hypothetical protein